MIAAMARLDCSDSFPPRQDDGVAALDAQRRRVAGDVGPALVEKQHDADRHADLCDAQAVGANISFDDLPDRIDLSGDLLDAVGHGIDALVVQLQALDEGRLHLRLLGRFDILGIGGQKLATTLANRSGQISQRGDLHLAAQACQLRRGATGGFAQLHDILLQLRHRLEF